MTTEQLKQTPLHNWHAANGARIVDFTGWAMPVQYTSIIEEHNATRTAVGLFDVSHMARFRFDGPNALAFIDGLVTRKVSDLKPGRIRYGLVCQEDGGILDDILVYHLQDSSGQDYTWLVVNAGNREKIAAWIQQRLPSDVTFTDRTEQTAMIAVQGPKAIAVAQDLVEGDLSELKYYQGREAQVLGHAGLVSRTGYTGEDGVEITVSAENAVEVWEKLVAAAKSVGGQAVGLGARDTLRLEAAMPLYGHELSESVTPLQAGLDFTISWDHDFIGKGALEQLDKASLPVRVGLVMQDRRVPREHYGLFAGDQQVGEVTSGTQSPTLNQPIAMAYVQPPFAEAGQMLDVDIRGKRHPAKVVPLPFYRRNS